MLDSKISKMLNAQINKELFSSYLYLDIANYFYNENLSGFGNWFDVQTKEEASHAMLFVQYMRDNGEEIILEQIDRPQDDFTDHRAVLALVLEHEKFITSSINEIYGEALAIKDFRTTQFLDWFIKEQLEEEVNAEDLLRQYELFGTDPKGLYLINNDLAKRNFSEVEN